MSSGEIHPLSVSLQHGIRLLPHPFDAVLSARLTVRFPRVGGQRRYFVHLLNHQVRVVPLGRQRCIRDRRTLNPYSWLLTFWFKPVSTLCVHAGLSNITAFISTYFELTLSRTASPRPPCDAGSRRLGSRSDDRSLRIEVTLSPRLRTGFMPARWSSRPMAEHRVTSFILLYVSVTDSENATNRTNALFGAAY